MYLWLKEYNFIIVILYFWYFDRNMNNYEKFEENCELEFVLELRVTLEYVGN